MSVPHDRDQAPAGSAPARRHECTSDHGSYVDTDAVRQQRRHACPGAWWNAIDRSCSSRETNRCDTSRLIQAVVLLRQAGGQQPPLGLYEARDPLIERHTELERRDLVSRDSLLSPPSSNEGYDRAYHQHHDDEANQQLPRLDRDHSREPYLDRPSTSARFCRSMNAAGASTHSTRHDRERGSHTRHHAPWRADRGK